MDHSQLLAIYRVMLTARAIDRVEQELTRRGEAFFHISGSGHEATSVLARHLKPQDYLHCHYRDKALMLARGMTPRSFFDAVLCKDRAASRGRQMSAHLSDRRLHIISMTGPVGNSALEAVGVAAAVRHQDERPIVLCGTGDGTTQEGDYLEACGEAVRSALPVLFLIEDNRWAISTETAGRTFYSWPGGGRAADFFGRPIHYVDGSDVIATEHRFGEIVTQMRHDRLPAFVVLQVERLNSHTNADDQTVYREAEDLRRAQQQRDPLRRLEQVLREQGSTAAELEAIRAEVEAEVAAAEAESAAGPEPAAVHSAKRSLPVELTHPSRERSGSDTSLRLTMRDALRETLRHHLRTDPRVVLFGEDIEDPKGDVFGVTKGLSTQFPGRVLNSPLAESTIVGASVGRALAGQRPVAFIQFADFLPLALNQIMSELGTMYWRSDGEWQAPVVVMIPCGGYRPGLGPFHAQSFEAVAAHTPGLDVCLPSTAADAAGLLNAALASQRPTLFFYPKSMLNDPERTTSADVAAHLTPLGTARKLRSGRDLTYVAWGNTVRLCERAAAELEKIGMEAEILDLRTLSPWDERAVLASAEKTAHLIVVHEDNHTCGFGAEVLATVAEKVRVPVAMRRVTRGDTYVPCNYANQLEVLPSLRRVLETTAELLDLDLTWIPPKEQRRDRISVEAIGSGPADETVIVAEMYVRPGDVVRRGDAVAALEATKSVFDVTSSSDGEVVEIAARAGDTVAVGAPLVHLRPPAGTNARPVVTQDSCGTPVLLRRPSEGRLLLPRKTSAPRRFDVGMSSIAVVEGSRQVTNQELLEMRTSPEPAGMTADDVVRRTGIERRCWVGQGESAVSLAVQACWQLLDREQLIPDDLNLVICSTTSPNTVTPSMACQVLNGLNKGKAHTMLQAYDINAACSGYLYALQAGYDFLQSTPQGRVLIVTAEVLSPLLDPNDFDTSILFGDAASATILYGEEFFDRAGTRVHRPELCAKGDDGDSLSVPLPHDGFIHMKGRRVFSEAVRAMVSSLNRVCQREGVEVDKLKMIVPHQANQRILDAIQCRVGAAVYSNIRRHGNTSSTSIPLCLAEISSRISRGDRLGLCAFGGGFTFGAGILDRL